jgi:hypothetical protein
MQKPARDGQLRFPVDGKSRARTRGVYEDHLVATYGFKRAESRSRSAFIVFWASGVLSLNESSNAFAIRPLLTPCKNA